MKPLELNPQEQDMLVQVLQRCLADLNHEIGHTHYAEFKHMLRERRDIIEGIMRKLPARVEQAA